MARPLVAGNLALSQLYAAGCNVTYFDDSFATKQSSTIFSTNKFEQRHKIYRPTNGMSGYVTGGDGQYPGSGIPNLTDGSGGAAAFTSTNQYNAFDTCSVAAAQGMSPKTTRQVIMSGSAYGAGSPLISRLYLSGTGWPNLWADGNPFQNVAFTTRTAWLKLTNGAAGVRVQPFGPGVTPYSDNLITTTAGAATQAYQDFACTATDFSGSGTLGCDCRGDTATTPAAGSAFVHLFNRHFVPGKVGLQLDCCSYAGQDTTRTLSMCSASAMQWHLNAVGTQIVDIALGTNDAGIGQAALQANLVTIMNQCLTGTGVVGFVLRTAHANPSRGDTWCQAIEEAMYAIATSRSDTLFSNLYRAMPSQASMQQNYLDEASPGGLHPNGAGCVAEAATEWQLIELAASLSRKASYRASRFAQLGGRL